MNKLFQYFWCILIVFVITNIYTNTELQAAKALKMLSCDTLVFGHVYDDIAITTRIQNISTNVINIKLKVNITQLADSSAFLICLNPTCHSINSVQEVIFQGTVSLAPSAELGGAFTCSLNAGTIGNSTAIFTFYNNADTTDFVSFTTTIKVIPTDVIDNNVFSDLSISPNPANDLLNINFSNTALVGINEIKIFDITGNNILSQQLVAGLNQQSLNISSLSSGIYEVAYISNGTIKEIKKLSVVK